MKPCPYCAELIQDQAAKCRYCGEWLDPNKRPAWSADAVVEAPAAHVPTRPGSEPVVLEDEPEMEATNSGSTLRVGSGLPDLATTPGGEPARSWSAPAWLANAQAARAEPDPPAREPASHDRPTLEEVALRMERIRQSAAAVRQAAEPHDDLRHHELPRARATLEVEPGVTLPAGSLRAADLDLRGTARRGARDDQRTVTRPPQPAPVVHDEFEDFEDEPVPTRRARGTAGPRAERPAAMPEAPWESHREPSAPAPSVPEGRRRRARAEEAELDDARDLRGHHDEPEPERGRSGARKRRREPEPEPEPAVLPADFDDDGDDDFDAAVPRRGHAPAPGLLADEFEDDFDDEDGDGGYDDFGDMSSAPAPLPWKPIAVGAVVVALALGFFFRDSLFPGDGEADAAAEGDSDGAAKADEAGGEEGGESKAKAAPEPVPEAKANGEGQPVEPDAAAEGGAVPTADGGAVAAPPAPVALDAATLAKLDKARTAYLSADGNTNKLQQAGDLLGEILAKMPDHPEALTLMAQVHLEQGKTEEALATATRCTEVSAERADCWLTIGVIQAEIYKKYDVAQVALEKYLALSPDGRYAKDAKAALAKISRKVGK